MRFIVGAGLAPALLSAMRFISAMRSIAGAGLAPRGVNLSTAVILRCAQDLHSAQREILRCAQDDRWRAGGSIGVNFST